MRPLSLLLPILLRYGVFNRVIPDAALSASVDPMWEFAPKTNNLRVFRKKSVSVKLKALMMPSDRSSKVKPGLPSTLFLVFDVPIFPYFTFLSQKLYHLFNSERKCAPSFVILLLYFSYKIFAVILRL